MGMYYYVVFMFIKFVDFGVIDNFIVFGLEDFCYCCCYVVVVDNVVGWYKNVVEFGDIWFVFVQFVGVKLFVFDIVCCCVFL